jgi:hypothetical protein
MLPLDTTPNYPPCHAADVASAARSLPAALEDLPDETGLGAPQPEHGHRVVLAKQLVEALVGGGHRAAAAAWAIHDLIQRGLLLADVASTLERPIVGFAPRRHSAVAQARRFFGSHADAPHHQVPVYGAPVRRPLAPPGRPVPYDQLLVLSTAALWQWRLAPAVVGGEQGSPRPAAAPPSAPSGGQAAAGAGSAAEPSAGAATPFIASELQERILAALEGKALTLDALVARLDIDRSTLYRDGIKELRARGLIANHRRLGGYYRRDALPPKYAEVLGQKPS